MDVEVEQVVNLLFPDGVPDSWKEKDEFVSYIIDLASCGVEKLSKEGGHLVDERSAILDQTRDLAFTNYKTFIHTADCTKVISKDFVNIEDHLSALSARLPVLRECVDAFLAKSRSLAASRHLTSLTLAKHTQLLEVNKFLSVLEYDLKRGIGSNLESVLSQCMFFGQSFSRIGADFRPLLAPIFQDAALSQFEKDVRTANIKFDETLSSFSLMETQETSPSAAFLVETQDKTRPPLGLMEFPPLAHYTNGLVNAFNNLRQCCPVALLAGVAKCLHNSLTKVISALIELHRMESSGFTAREDASFQRMCRVLSEGLLSHINVCIRLLFPLKEISIITGISITNLEKQKFGLLETMTLLEPIEHLLPKKEDKPIAKEELMLKAEESIAKEEQMLKAEESIAKEELMLKAEESIPKEEQMLKPEESITKEELILKEEEPIAKLDLMADDSVILTETQVLQEDALLAEPDLKEEKLPKEPDLKVESHVTFTVGDEEIEVAEQEVLMENVSEEKSLI